MDRVLVEMLAPYKGRVYDPCCGSAGMFVQSEKFVEEHGGRIGDIAVYGQESNSTTRRLSSRRLQRSRLTVAALPDHATTLRAFRRPAGGTAELAGTSATTTVSLTDLGPLTTGVTYEFWLVGHNSQGDGPENNHFSHVAT